MKAQVTFSNGKTATIEGDSREQIMAAVDEIEAGFAPQRDLSAGETVAAGIPETALSLASSVVAEPIAGLAGIAGSILPGEPGQGAEFVEKTRDALTFEPRSEAGQRTLAATGEALAPIGELFQKGVQASGDAAFEAAGGDSEAAAVAGAAGQAGFEAAIGAIPIIGPAIKRSANKMVQASRADIAEAIQAKSSDKQLAGFDLDEAGNVVRSKEADAALSHDFDEGVIGSLHAANDADIKSLMKMVDITEKSKGDALFGATNRPSDVVGDTIAKRIRHIKRVNQQGGKEVNAVVRRLKGPVDTDSAVDGLIENLRDKGIRVDAEGKLDFEGSDLEGLDGPQQSVIRLVERMQSATSTDARTVHRLKKFIDENVTFGKSQEGLGGETERIIKQFRFDLNKALGDQFPEYAAANKKYSDTLQALEDFQQSAGKRIDLFGEGADKAIGTRARSLLSNQQNRVNLLNSIKEIEDLANQYGGTFNDNVILQAVFVDELGRRFGAAAKTSLQGDTEKAAARAVRGGVREAVVDAAAERVGKVFGKTDEAAIKAMRALLRRHAKGRVNRKPSAKPSRRAGQKTEPTISTPTIDGPISPNPNE